MMEKKILLIEDSPTDAAIVKELLGEGGLRVEVAGTAKDGIQKAKEMKPDIILLDLILPDGSGIDVCQALKADPSLFRTIVVVLTVKDDVDTIEKAFKAGADDYMVKPTEPEFLVRRVKLYLGIRL